MIGEAAKNSKKTTTLHDAVALYFAQRHEPERSGTGDGAKRHVHNDRFGATTVPTEIATMVIDAPQGVRRHA